MYSRKGKRKIVINGEIYYWCAKWADEWYYNYYIEDAYMELSVFSETQFLFKVDIDEKHTKTEYDLLGNNVFVGESPVTPAIVREMILEKLKTAS